MVHDVENLILVSSLSVYSDQAPRTQSRPPATDFHEPPGLTVAMQRSPVA